MIILKKNSYIFQKKIREVIMTETNRIEYRAQLTKVIGLGKEVVTFNNDISYEKR